MNDKLKQLEQDHIMQTYKRIDLLLQKGDGCYVYDQAGKKYLDFIGGIATCPVGHSNPAVTKAIMEQAERLISVSNLYYTEPQIHLAQKLSKLSGLQKTFFCHSGADANEAAIKLAKKVTGKKAFIAFKNAFHGRTTGSLALTWKQQYKQPFLPLAPHVQFADYNDVASLRALITDDTAAVIVEPMQGEAGIIVPSDTFLKAVREVCNEYGVLMIVDEVQTGVGRTGRFFAYQHFGIKPDIVTVAKGLANGLPIGACLSDLELGRGDHGSTLGGNNLSAAAALATLDYIEEHDLMKNAETVGGYLMEKLQALQKTTPLIAEVRGRGLMIGIELAQPVAAKVCQLAQQQGLICNPVTETVIRLLPPLIVTKQQVDEAVDILAEALQP